MTRAWRFTSALMQGFLLGMAIVFLLIVGICLYAFVSDRQVVVSGFFRVIFDQENGLSAMSFEPDFVGMATVALCTALVYALVSLSRDRADRGVPGHDMLPVDRGASAD